METPEINQTQTPEETQTIEIEQITPETIKKLIKRASPIEQKYLLILEDWSRQGDAYVDFQRFEVVYGEADVVTLREWDEGYPYRRGAENLIIPKTIPVVIRVERFSNTQSPTVYEEEIYIFTADGWKRVEIR